MEELRRRRAGYEGELSLDYYYRSLPKQKYWIFHDLNLLDVDYNCQIDTLLLTPELALIIEVKNMTGKLIFDTDNEQFIQRSNDNEKGYPDPIAQSERHQKCLKKLFATHNLPPVPIDYIVVISNCYASYVISGKNTHKVKPRVCKSDAFLNKLQYFEKRYVNPVLNTKDLKKLSRLLIKINTPPTNYLLENWVLRNQIF